MPRLETGVVQMPDDWPGVFIRGDDAIHLGLQLQRTIARLRASGDIDNAIERATLLGLARTLMSCNARDDAAEIQEIDWFNKETTNAGHQGSDHGTDEGGEVG